MSAKNITSEKMDTSGFSTGGYSGMSAKHTPAKAVIDDQKRDDDTAVPKRVVGAGKESKNSPHWKG